MDNAFFSVLRQYKNAAGDTIRIDEISLSGFFMRKNLYGNWARGRDYNATRNTPGEPYYDLNDPIFHCNTRGRKVSSTLLNLGEPRTVSTIDMVGSWTAIAAGPDYDNVTWRGGVVDLTDLPSTGDTV